MSLITRCPACGTMFKVVPDQLRISQGWVRCGHCAEVFDATASLQEADAAVAPSALGPSGAAVEPPPPAFREEPPPAEPVRVPYAAYEEPLARAPVPVRAPAPIAPAAASSPRDIDPFDSLDSAPAPVPVGLPDPGPPYPSYPPFVSQARESAFDETHETHETPQAHETPDLGDVSFVREARRKAFWQRPAVRAVLLLVLVALAALLAAQYAVHERDRLAAAEPALRPLLEAVCEPLKCRVGPPRQIEVIAIDSSSFSKLRGDAYRLVFTLKNQSATEVAMPAVELTLTDTQDQAVIRRVLQPREMGAGAPVIAGNSEWQGSLAISVPLSGNTPRVSGYRLLAFYP